MSDLFASSQRPDPSLFFNRGEPGDPRLGESVLCRPEEYPAADVVLLGCPQDEGVRRNGGRTGAAQAPKAIRKFLYRLVAAPGVRLFDLGDTVLQDSLEATHALHEAIVQQVLTDGKRLVVLGGGNDISYPDCSALAATSRSMLAFNIDAHLDVRDSPVRHSGTPYRMLLEEGILQPQLFSELAYQPFAVAANHLEYLRLKGVTAMSAEQLRIQGLTAVIRGILTRSSAEAIFWGLDMDSVRASDAPGVSAPNPAGLYAEDVCRIAALAAQDSRSRIFEISEVNPGFDIDDRTARLAAAVVFHFLGRQS